MASGPFFVAVPGGGMSVSCTRNISSEALVSAVGGEGLFLIGVGCPRFDTLA